VSALNQGTVTDVSQVGMQLTSRPRDILRLIRYRYFLTYTITKRLNSNGAAERMTLRHGSVVRTHSCHGSPGSILNTGFCFKLAIQTWLSG
jgi:hypothetical protein